MSKQNKKTEEKKEGGLTVTNKMIVPLIEDIKKLEITDKSSMAIAVEDLSRVNKYLDSVIKYKEKKTKPLNELKKAILAETKPLESILEDLVSQIKGKMTTYQTEQVRIQKEEEDKIASRIGEGKGKLKVETAVKQIDALDTPETSVTSDSGKVMFKTVKRFEVVDMSLLPLEYHVADDFKIRDAMKAGIEVAGVRYYEEQVPINFR